MLTSQWSSQDFEDFKNAARKHPIRFGLIGACAVTLLAPAVVTGPALGVLGFGASGLIGGTIAAGVQGGIGNVAAGSIFATLQSAAMGGYGIAAVNGVVAAGAGAVGVVTGVSMLDTGTKDSAETRREDEGESKEHLKTDESVTSSNTETKKVLSPASTSVSNKY